jgi:hypothetical protein
MKRRDGEVKGESKEKKAKISREREREENPTIDSGQSNHKTKKRK